MDFTPFPFCLHKLHKEILLEVLKNKESEVLAREADLWYGQQQKNGKGFGS